MLLVYDISRLLAMVNVGCAESRFILILLKKGI